MYDNIEHPVCYFSKLLKKHQRGYSTVEKEAMALRQAVPQFKVYFDRSPITVYTDHSHLKYLNTMANHKIAALEVIFAGVIPPEQPSSGSQEASTGHPFAPHPG